MRILVTGGAGYIGSHTVRELISGGHRVFVYDNLSKGHRSAVPKELLIQGDTGDAEKLSHVFQSHKIEAVVHFAAYSLVGESALKPSLYYNNNVANTLELLDCMLENGINKVVFSSTAAVYGEPEEVPITENCKKEPTNVYGISKLMVEKILESYDRAYGLKYISLRYFNAAGAEASGEIGEHHEPESHLIPIVLQVALGQRANLQVFGNDYNTPDGTCIRDYVHVTDLANAHVLALQALNHGSASNAYNLGNGKGFSVRQVVEAAQAVTGKVIPTVEVDRRVGDPAILVASSDKIQKELGWQPRFASLTDIIASAWKWHSCHQLGYNDAE